MHLRSAALITTILVIVPYCAFFYLVGIPSFKAIAVNLALVCCAMVTILFIYFRDFANLVASRKSLIDKQQETQQLSDENFRIANRDSLTDLPNRRSFFADLEACQIEARQIGATFAVGIIDLDGFKPVNDTHGHAAGDAVLVEVGRRLRMFRSVSVSFARLGGDEFAVLIRDPASDHAIRAFGGELCDAIRLPYQVGASSIQLSCSIGVARFSEPCQTLQMLYERADYALYCAKGSAKGNAVLFGSQHETEIQTSRVIEQALSQADLDAELSLMFQPIISTTDGHPVSFEALARWTSPTLGLVSPGEFIPTAERMGIICDLTRVLLAKAIEVAKTWPETIRLSFNLSVYDICSAEAALAIIALVNRCEIDPRRIDFEVTETAVAYDFSQALSTVVALRALGCGISLDDFGTGFSSLSHLHRLPLDKVKVDRSFVDEITKNPVSHKIVKSLMALCADMGLKCIIEGVETEEQETMLLRMGCDYIQGYYYARPMTAEKAADFVADRFNVLPVFHHTGAAVATAG
jgi:diguanylate cyclase (GGDEF)-like protein